MIIREIQKLTFSKATNNCDSCFRIAKEAALIIFWAVFDLFYFDVTVNSETPVFN